MTAVDDLYKIAKIFLVVIIILFISFYTSNEITSYKYQTQLLENPCNACVEKNPNLEWCFFPSMDSYVNLTGVMEEQR